MRCLYEINFRNAQNTLYCFSSIIRVRPLSKTFKEPPCCGGSEAIAPMGSWDSDGVMRPGATGLLKRLSDQYGWLRSSQISLHRETWDLSKYTFQIKEAVQEILFQSMQEMKPDLVKRKKAHKKVHHKRSEDHSSSSSDDQRNDQENLHFTAIEDGQSAKDTTRLCATGCRPIVADNLNLPSRNAGQSVDVNPLLAMFCVYRCAWLTCLDDLFVIVGSLSRLYNTV